MYDLLTNRKIWGMLCFNRLTGDEWRVFEHHRTWVDNDVRPCGNFLIVCILLCYGSVCSYCNLQGWRFL